MSKKTLYFVIAVIAIAAAGAWLFGHAKLSASVASATASSSPASSSSSGPLPHTDTNSYPLYRLPAVAVQGIYAYPADAVNDITVTNPLPDAFVSSPLTITGSVIGQWYFNGFFPITIVDGNGLVLGGTDAQALGGAGVAGKVPFSGTLFFSPPPTTTGFLILEHDNSSGGPVDRRFIKIPVRFR